ncbi:MAG: class I SAM-dependent methyltransferase [Desulfofustis sp.]|jgi:16S rRNA (guanine1516-N2)-methyltransferase
MDIKPRVGVCLDHADPDQTAYLEELMKTAGLERLTGSPAAYGFSLGFHGNRLELEHVRDVESSPLYVDFLAGSSYYRFIHDRRINQPLAKAAGLKAGYRPLVLDATAGFGEDGFVLASLGCQVTMIERSPVIWALLADALRRAAENETLGPLIRQNLKLCRGDSLEYLKNGAPRFDTVYLDPMYPPRSGSALNRKKMRLLKELVGDDPDAPLLLKTALGHAVKRVSVKRPKKAGPLGRLAPSFSISAKSSRYDIYLIPYL